LSFVNARGLFHVQIGKAVASPAVAALHGRFPPDLDRRRTPRGPFLGDSDPTNPQRRSIRARPSAAPP
jgi:hypothetical protein